MTRILDLDGTRAAVDGLLHLDTQAAAVGLDLTADRVFRVTRPGSVDFGGGELEPAGRDEIVAELRSDDDEYGWWELDPGSYVLRYNESLSLDEGSPAWVLPLERLLLAGASHAAFVADGSRQPLETLLRVGTGGCHLKENCRVSRVVLFASDQEAGEGEDP